MNFVTALNSTLEQFNIKNRELARLSGVDESSISRYRNGTRDLQAETLQKLISALPKEARDFFYFRCLLSDLDEDGVATLLIALGQRIKRSNKEQLAPEQPFALAS